MTKFDDPDIKLSLSGFGLVCLVLVWRGRRDRKAVCTSKIRWKTVFFDDTHDVGGVAGGEIGVGR